MPDDGQLINIDFKSLSEVAKAFIDKVSEGVAGWAKPWQIERLAKAEANASIIKTGAELNANKLRALAGIELTEIEQRALVRFLGSEERNQRNIEGITAKTLGQLEPDAKPQEMKADWVAHVFEKCKTVSDQEMQNMWSRLIAGEANRPGTFSKRTVETVAILEKEDAELFTALCGFGWKVGNRFFPLYCDPQSEIYTSKSLGFDAMNHFASLGLLSFSGTTAYHLTKQPQYVFLQYYGLLFPGEFRSPSDNLLPIGFAMLTAVGAQLSQICGASPVEGFISYAIDWWKSQGVNIQTYDPKREMHYCDWCKYLGKTSYSGSSWSEGERAIKFCHDHFGAFQTGMGETTQEMQKVWNHEAIQAWKAAGYPNPKGFFGQWKKDHRL